MNELKLILAGLGGQGVVFLTRLLAQTAVALGHAVMVSETHGMSQRGGSVISHLKIGGDEAPLIQREVAGRLEQFGLQVLSLPASQMAVSLGAPAVANVILAGFAAAHPTLSLPFETLHQTLATIAPRGRELNLRALETGHNHFGF
ncbi:MAG: hypothetical protein DPW09_27160 [Anaerolineae bacterium]|nr:hypothetical protein [Anaerolineae bacterium]